MHTCLCVACVIVCLFVIKLVVQQCEGLAAGYM